jgi:hypothetical protein
VRRSCAEKGQYAAFAAILMLRAWRQERTNRMPHLSGESKPVGN